MVRGVVGGSGHSGHGAAAFGVGAHGHEHTPHVRMMNDGAGLGQAAVNRAALHPVARILHRLLVSPLGDRDALHAHRITGRVHHDEHVFEAAVFLADQEAHRAGSGAVCNARRNAVAVLKYCRRTGLDAHLVLNAHAVHIVALAQRAVVIDQHLGHHKQADALDAFGRALHPGQHQMDDVLSHVVLTVGDVDLSAEDFVSAIGHGLGAGAHRRQVGAGLRLGQVHGAAPLAGDQLIQVLGLHGVGASRQQRLNRTVGEHGAQGKAHIGRIEHLATGRADQLGQALTTVLGWVLQPLPASLAELLVGLLEARGGAHAAAVVEGRVLVALPVQGRQHFLVELGALLEHRLRGVVAGVLKARNLGDLVNTGKMPDVEQHVLQGGGIAHDQVLQRL